MKQSGWRFDRPQGHERGGLRLLQKSISCGVQLLKTGLPVICAACRPLFQKFFVPVLPHFSGRTVWRVICVFAILWIYPFFLTTWLFSVYFVEIRQRCVWKRWKNLCRSLIVIQYRSEVPVSGFKHGVRQTRRVPALSWNGSPVQAICPEQGIPDSMQWTFCPVLRLTPDISVPVMVKCGGCF